MKGKRVLVVEDDLQVQDVIASVFKDAGADVFVASDGEEGLRFFFNEKPELVILDIMMPKLDGFEMCSRIRQVSSVPVILLTALNSNDEIVQGLDAGADDFITKPFSVQILLARARSVLRRAEFIQETVPHLLYSDSYLSIDLEKRLVLVEGEPIKLTRTEYNLLAYLVKKPGWTRTFQQILDNVWGPEYHDSLDYVHVYVSHLRRKIEKDPKNPQYLETEHGVGYRFNSLEND